MTEHDRPIARLRDVALSYHAKRALDAITLEIPSGCMVGLIGSDGVGKSSLLGLVAGARRIQAGEVEVLGGNMANAAHRNDVCTRIAYMPQGLGRNLYPDLSVRENIEFFGRLFGLAGVERRRRIAELLESTGLAPFPDRPARKLSGGMRQKLGLCCALIHDPDLLILDEPTTGVDPLSRRQFWDLIGRMRARHSTMSVIIATAYMEEAERFDWLIAMDAGKVLAAGSPDEFKASTNTTSLESAFIALLPEQRRMEQGSAAIPPRASAGREVTIMARDLTCRFGDFTAVDRVNFEIKRGEIFGFLGPNGCGKTTTMKMLTGLLPATEGEAFLLGNPIDAADLNSRYRVGYMSQSFSLYLELTVRQNLALHARLYQLPANKAKSRIDELVRDFALDRYLDRLASQLPLGIRQRLSLAVAIVHEPEMLILDEPTSGVDPLARDQFWQILLDLSRNRNVTIFVSTHFMNEAARCDRIALMSDGRVLATDTPEGLIKARGAANLEEAFISHLEEADGRPLVSTDDGHQNMDLEAAPGLSARPKPTQRSFSLRRMLAFTTRETLELIRDPVRISFALLGTALLMIIFGFGITTDVDSLAFGVLDRDQTPESRAYIGEIRGSRYFIERPPILDDADLERRLKNNDVKATIEIAPGFGRDIKKGVPVSVGVWLDGAMPFRAETIRGYLQGVHSQYLTDPAINNNSSASPAANIEFRFRYNQDFKSVYTMVPATMAMLLVLIPAILMALAIVREKELGSITNFYVTPVTRIEFLIGKQIPYIAVAFISFFILLAITVLVFRVPLKGSVPALVLGALLYVATTTGYGMLISSFARSQIAALFGTAILSVIPATQFSGMLTPVSSLSGIGAFIGQIFPMTYFVRISVGTITKGLGFRELGMDLAALAVFIPAMTLLSIIFLRKQEA